MIDPTSGHTSASSESGAKYLGVFSVLATKMSSAFYVNDLFWVVVSCWALSFLFGTLNALRNSWLGLPDGYSPKKSTDGMFILLGWWSLFHVTNHFRSIGGDGGKLFSDFVEYACVLTQCAWLFKTGSRLVNAKWAMNTADTLEEAAESIAEKAQEVIKTKLGLPNPPEKDSSEH
jgi:hypothetical protein